MKLLLATAMFLAAGVSVSAQGPAFGGARGAAVTANASTIETARELYASARYDEALTLLNDELFLEMSRALAETACERHGDDPASCATFIFRRLITRPPQSTELTAILDYHRAQTERLESGALSAREIAQSNDASPALAAWMMTARALMNVDEAMTKP